MFQTITYGMMKMAWYLERVPEGKDRIKFWRPWKCTEQAPTDITAGPVSVTFLPIEDGRTFIMHLRRRNRDLAALQVVIKHPNRH